MSAAKALIVNGSPRKHGNTTWIATRVYEMLEKKGIETRFVSAGILKSLNNGCIGCKGCQKSDQFLCVFKDDVQPLVASMPEYRYVIFATPIYFFGPTAQTKLVLDRMYSLMKVDEGGKVFHPFHGTKFGLILTAGGTENEGCDLATEMFRRTADFYGTGFETLAVAECLYDPGEYGPDETKLLTDKANEFLAKLVG